MEGFFEGMWRVYGGCNSFKATFFGGVDVKREPTNQGTREPLAGFFSYFATPVVRAKLAGCRCPCGGCQRSGSQMSCPGKWTQAPKPTFLLGDLFQFAHVSISRWFTSGARPFREGMPLDRLASCNPSMAIARKGSQGKETEDRWLLGIY